VFHDGHPFHERSFNQPAPTPINRGSALLMKAVRRDEAPVKSVGHPKSAIKHGSGRARSREEREIEGHRLPWSEQLYPFRGAMEGIESGVFQQNQIRLAERFHQ